jgi:hypothetical protein
VTAAHRRELAPLIDPSSTIELDNGTRLAEAVHVDGSRSLWLMQDPEGTPGCPDRCCSPHEDLGKLPAAYRARISVCGAPTRTGRPCRNLTPPGQLCRCHAEPATDPGPLDRISRPQP